MTALRDEVRAWIAATCSPDRPRREVLELVVDRGYAVPSSPKEWFGLGLSVDDSRVVAEELVAAGLPGARQDVHNLWANTLLTYGTDALKHELLRRLLLDDVRMCLLYSEPGAGSDLAGLQTRADRDGDDFVVTGQKVWTTGGYEAEYGMLIARTDWDAPKHRGISFFFLPMQQPGVEVRPLKQITGEAHFNEVFLDGARVPAKNLLGGLHEGWRVLQTALAYERSVMGDVARGVGGTGATDVDLWSIAKDAGRANDPVVRQAIAWVHSLRTVNRWNAARAKAQLQQGSSSPILSLGKLAMSRILHEGARVQQMILGADAMLVGADNPGGDAAAFLALNAYFTSIGGGTDQIQRNIIGERVLGLPREPDVDRDIPFREVRKATTTREAGR